MREKAKHTLAFLALTAVLATPIVGSANVNKIPEAEIPIEGLVTGKVVTKH